MHCNSSFATAAERLENVVLNSDCFICNLRVLEKSCREVVQMCLTCLSKSFNQFVGRTFREKLQIVHQVLGQAFDQIFGQGFDQGLGE